MKAVSESGEKERRKLKERLADEPKWTTGPGVENEDDKDCDGRRRV